MAKIKQRRHTCRDCETVFFSSAKRPIAPTRLATMGAKMQASGAGMSVFSGGASKGGYSMQANRMEAKRDMEKAWLNPTCVNCGSAAILTEIIKVKV